MSCQAGQHDGYIFDHSETSDAGVVWNYYRCACGATLQRRQA